MAKDDEQDFFNSPTVPATSTPAHGTVPLFAFPRFWVFAGCENTKKRAHSGWAKKGGIRRGHWAQCLLLSYWKQRTPENYFRGSRSVVFTRLMRPWASCTPATRS